MSISSSFDLNYNSKKKNPSQQHSSSYAKNPSFKFLRLFPRRYSLFPRLFRPVDSRSRPANETPDLAQYRDERDNGNFGPEVGY
jgi:hypothetical protein